MDPFRVLDSVVERYTRILKDNLIGIYLHGSLAMGCYSEHSDIDFLVVVNDPIDSEIKRALVDELLRLEGLPRKGIEMSVILMKYARAFEYPTPFELHYSEMRKERYLRDRHYVCGGGVDKDLAAHMTVVKHRGVLLLGREIAEVFADVPRKYFVDSILHDVKDARTGIVHNPVDYSLNLCRVLYYLRHHGILSKLEGGKWGVESLPPEFRGLLKTAVEMYQNQVTAGQWDPEALIQFADYMLKEIYSLVSAD